MNLRLARRIGKLESRNVDATGLKPHSEAWFAFWEEKLDRLWAGEDIGNIRIPIEVTDRMIAAADAEDDNDKLATRGVQTFPLLTDRPKDWNPAMWDIVDASDSEVEGHPR